jgi:hypothetical protein
MEGIRIQNTTGYLWPDSAPLADLPWLPVARCCPPGWPTLITSGPPLSPWLAYLGYQWPAAGPAAVPPAGLPLLPVARRCPPGWPTLVTSDPLLSPRLPTLVISGPPLSPWLAYLGYQWPAAVPLASVPPPFPVSRAHHLRKDVHPELILILNEGKYSFLVNCSF